MTKTPTKEETLTARLIAIFPLLSTHSNAAIGIPVKSTQAFQHLRLAPGIDIVSPEAIDFQDPAYWINTNEDDVDDLTCEEKDAYSDVFNNSNADDSGDGDGWKLYKDCMEDTHLSLLEESWTGLDERRRRLKRVPQPSEENGNLRLLGLGPEQGSKCTLNGVKYRFTQGGASGAGSGELGTGDEVRPLNPIERLRAWQKERLRMVFDLIGREVVPG